MTNYIELAEKLSTARSQDKGKPVANNTRLFRRDDEAIAVRLHDTDVCVFHLNGNVTLDTGGWRTLTTRDRINSFSPARVFTEKGLWYIAGAGSQRWPFSDGVIVDGHGTPCDGSQPDDGTQRRKASRTDRLIKRFVDGFAKHIKGHGVTDPSASDCLYCQLHNRDGKAWGEVPSDGHPHGDVGHLASHINESYYVPSLAWNSVVEAGYREPPYIWRLCHDSNGYAEDTIKRTLRNYLRKRKTDLAEIL